MRSPHGNAAGTVAATVLWTWSGISGDAPTGTTNPSTYTLETDGADAGETLTVTASLHRPGFR